MPDKYDVFKRRPWRRNANKQWEPHGGARKTYIRRGVTFEEARQICEIGNAKNVRGKPGQIWHEFERS